MAKVVVLTFDGDLQTAGFRVNLEIAPEGAGSQIEMTGHLPPFPELATHLRHHWLEIYRNLDSASRIKPKSVKCEGVVNPVLKECQESAEKLRSHFTQWLQSEQFRQIDARLREDLNRDEEVRLLIRTEDSVLQKLPWHLWDFVKRYSNIEVAFSPREYKKPESSLRVPSKNKVRILAIFGNSQGIEVEGDKAVLEKLPQADVTFLTQPKHHEINEHLWEQSWDIIFFAGHSETLEGTGHIYINSTDSLTLEELWYGLRKAVDKGLQLVIFNSCDGLGLARQLDDIEIPQTIVMRELVPDRVAQKFLQDFLANFASGKSLYTSCREARERLQGWESEYPCASWLPVICQNPAAVPPTWEDLLGQGKQPPLPALHLRSPAQRLSLWRQINQGIPQLIAIPLGLGVGLASWMLAMPQLARVVNDIGYDYYQAGKLAEAQQALKLAIFLNPNNRVAPYTLGWICEQVGDFEGARTYYQKSGKLGLAAAYSRLSRIAIQQDRDYNRAVNLARSGLELVKDDRTKYALLKNFAWARLMQERYLEALDPLEAAVAVNERVASAYCLKAQILEGLGDRKGAQVQWQTCLNLAEPQEPDQDVWIGMARQRLDSPSLARSTGVK